ncbi:TPA: ProQ/FINO family protein, partial [Escherichia coli]
AFKIGISKDVMAFISASPECGLTVKEWNCAVRMITGGYKYLQRISVAGTPRYGLDGKVHGTVTEEEALYAQAKLEKHTQRYNARMKETEDARCNQPSKTVTPDSNLKDACIHNGA